MEQGISVVEFRYRQACLMSTFSINVFIVLLSPFLDFITVFPFV